MLHCTFEGIACDASSTKAKHFLAADAAVGRAILQAKSVAVSEGILALASKCCNREVLEATCVNSTTAQDLQESMRAAIGSSVHRPALVRLPASLLAAGSCFPESGSWKQALQLFATAVRAVVHTARNESHSPSQHALKAPLRPPRTTASSPLPQNVGAEFIGDRCNEVCISIDSGLPGNPSPAATVVALLPVGLPGSGKTTVLLEALRPALRQEFMSSNTFSVGGVTGEIRKIKPRFLGLPFACTESCLSLRYLWLVRSGFGLISCRPRYLGGAASALVKEDGDANNNDSDARSYNNGHSSRCCSNKHNCNSDVNHSYSGSGFTKNSNRNSSINNSNGGPVGVCL